MTADELRVIIIIILVYIPGECFKPGFDGFVAQADSREDRSDIFGSSFF